MQQGYGGAGDLISVTRNLPQPEYTQTGPQPDYKRPAELPQPQPRPPPQTEPDYSPEQPVPQNVPTRPPTKPIQNYAPVPGGPGRVPVPTVRPTPGPALGQSGPTPAPTRKPAIAPGPAPIPRPMGPRQPVRVPEPTGPASTGQRQPMYVPEIQGPASGPTPDSIPGLRQPAYTPGNRPAPGLAPRPELALTPAPRPGLSPAPASRPGQAPAPRPVSPTLQRQPAYVPMSQAPGSAPRPALGPIATPAVGFSPRPASGPGPYEQTGGLGPQSRPAPAVGGGQGQRPGGSPDYDGAFDDGSYKGDDGQVWPAIRGDPGKDYPIYASVPETGFSCDQQDLPGYYGDPNAMCQVFHICQTDEEGQKRIDSFLCPNGTIFNQRYFVCDWWYNYDCSETEGLYSLNAELYKEPEPGREQYQVAPQPGARPTGPIQKVTFTPRQPAYVPNLPSQPAPGPTRDVAPSPAPSPVPGLVVDRVPGPVPGPASGPTSRPVPGPAPGPT